MLRNLAKKQSPSNDDIMRRTLQIYAEENANSAIKAGITDGDLIEKIDTFLSINRF